MNDAYKNQIGDIQFSKAISIAVTTIQNARQNYLHSFACLAPFNNWGKTVSGQDSDKF